MYMSFQNSRSGDMGKRARWCGIAVSTARMYIDNLMVNIGLDLNIRYWDDNGVKNHRMHSA